MLSRLEELGLAESTVIICNQDDVLLVSMMMVMDVMVDVMMVVIIDIVR